METEMSKLSYLKTTESGGYTKYNVFFPSMKSN